MREGKRECARLRVCERMCVKERKTERVRKRNMLLPQGERAYTTMRRMPVNNVKPFTLNKEEEEEAGEDDDDDEEEDEKKSGKETREKGAEEGSNGER